MKLEKEKALKIIREALGEDIGFYDVTTANIISKDEVAKAAIIAGENCVLCGINIAEWAVKALDSTVKFKPQAQEGERRVARQGQGFPALFDLHNGAVRPPKEDGDPLQTRGRFNRDDLRQHVLREDGGVDPQGEAGPDRQTEALGLQTGVG